MKDRIRGRRLNPALGAACPCLQANGLFHTDYDKFFRDWSLQEPA